MQHFEQPYGIKPLARFMPIKRDNLRSEVVNLIGEVVSWRYAGTGGPGEQYEGQQWWTTEDERFQGYWVPAEDLEEV